MGFFERLFETRYCNFCNSALPIFSIQNLVDGYCCTDCLAKLSPHYHLHKHATVAEIQNQLSARELNSKKYSEFHVTQRLGFSNKLLVDEKHSQFIVSTLATKHHHNPDVIDGSCILNSSINITESKSEIKYKDSNGNVKSFSPPSYAYTYNFFLTIEVDVPYIQTIRFRINDTPIDNDQPLLITIDGGFLRNIVDAFLPSISNNQKTSNADEVRNCPKYKETERVANEMLDILKSIRASSVNIDSSIIQSNKSNKVICPWCGSKVSPNDDNICNHCFGNLDA